MHEGIITTIRFFNDKDSNFIGAIVPLLTPLRTLQSEIIFKKGNHPNFIFFITKGRVSFFIEKKNIAFKDMIQGGYFGDVDIIFRRIRSLTARSNVDTDFLTLTKQIFEEVIVQDYPEVYQEMYLVAYERAKRIKVAKKRALEEYYKWAKKNKITDLADDKQLLLPEKDLFQFIQENEQLKESEYETENNKQTDLHEGAPTTTDIDEHRRESKDSMPHHVNATHEMPSARHAFPKVKIVKDEEDGETKDCMRITYWQDSDAVENKAVLTTPKF